MPMMPIKTLAVSKSASKIEQIPRSAARVNAEEAFEHIDQIDEKIKNETVENQRVQERDDRPGLENRLLGEHDPNRPPNPFRQMIETRIGFAARNRPVDIVEFDAAVIERAEREQHKKNFLEGGQHSGRMDLRSLPSYCYFEPRVKNCWRSVERRSELLTPPPDCARILSVVRFVEKTSPAPH